MTAVRRPFEMQLPSQVIRLSEAFRTNGYEFYVVGGAVRDAVMGVEPKDIDLATNATPDQVTEVLLSMVDWHHDEVGKSFGVIRAFFKELDSLGEFEIATFREDMTAGRHPEVRFATIVEDVQRRDLTINALFYDIQKKEVVDLVGGLEDIARGRIRTVGEPKDRFAEDRLRVLRALRFAARFGYALDEATSQAIMSDNNLRGVSPERIRDELIKSIASARKLDDLLALLDEHDMWPQVFPGLKVSNTRIHARSFEVVVALLLQLNEPAVTKPALNGLKYSSDEAAVIAALPQFRRLSADNAYDLRRLFQRTGLTVEELREFTHDRAFHLPRGLQLFEAYLASPPVKGEVLLASGYLGKALGEEQKRQETEIFRELLVTHGQ